MNYFTRISVTAVLIAMLAAGCSAGKKAEKGNPPRSAADAPVANTQQNQPAAKAGNSSLGAVAGAATLERFGKDKGNLFLYILDDSKMPKEVKPLAVSIYPAQAVKSKNFDFVIRNAPVGSYKIIAVWDTNPPYCKMTNTYCAASVKDGLGESEYITIKSGGTTSGVKIDVN